MFWEHLESPRGAVIRHFCSTLLFDTFVRHFWIAASQWLLGKAGRSSLVRRHQAIKPTPAFIPCSRSSSSRKKRTNLLVIILLLVLHDVEEPELVDTLAGADNTQPVTELLLLEELLREVLEVAAGELDVSHDLDLVAANLGDGDVVAEVAGAAVNLDAVVQELLEG